MTKIRVSITIDSNVWIAMKQHYDNISGSIEQLVVKDLDLKQTYTTKE